MSDRTNAPRKTRTVNAVETAFDIIDVLQERQGATVTELAEHLDVSKSTMHSHLTTLQKRGYLIKDDYEYRPSLRFLDIGEAVKRDHLDIYKYGRNEVKKLADQTNEYAWMLVEERGQGTYVYKSQGKDAVETGNYPLGRPVSLHSTADGKAILAHLPEERVREIIDRHGLEKVTENTITDEEELFDELAEIRESGVAFSSEESVPGIRSVAAPILDPGGSINGSISVSGPISRMKGDRYRETLPEMLIQCANIIQINVMSKRM